MCYTAASTASGIILWRNATADFPTCQRLTEVDMYQTRRQKVYPGNHFFSEGGALMSWHYPGALRCQGFAFAWVAGFMLEPQRKPSIPPAFASLLSVVSFNLMIPSWRVPKGRILVLGLYNEPLLLARLTVMCLRT